MTDKTKMTEEGIEWAYVKWLDRYTLGEIVRKLKERNKQLKLSAGELSMLFAERGLKRELPPLFPPDFWEEE